MAQFFISRPIFAWVIAIVIMLVGIVSIKQMPIAQYPSLAPPVITVSTIYPGASAQTAQDTVAQILEQQLNGLDGLRYLKSTSASNGTISVALTFELGTNPDIAQVQVQNKLQSATNLLPSDVQRQGLKINKSGASFLQVYAFYSESDRLSRSDISDYLQSNLADPISRVQGVGEIRVFGSSYAMRVWLDPEKLSNYSLTPSDVSNAINAQNVQVAVGQVGDTPSVEGQAFNATITAQSLLETPDQFENIFLKTASNGAQVRLSDVARVELGNDSYQVDAMFNGKPSSGIAIQLATGANALDTAVAVEEKMKELRPSFPQGMKDVIAFDTTPFIKLSIKSVVETLLEAILLVFLVMFLFLQNWRATIIPTMAVPVVVLGTFAAISAFGFSINTLTMFAMVLAIGLLVDDAIVVVENVERLMAEEHLGPVEATRKSMNQISGALVGITTVLAAVFVPMAFLSGSTGEIYRQFSLTIATAMGLSLLIALSFTPALCATILKKHDKAHSTKKTKKGIFAPIYRFFDWFFNRFNRFFDKLSNGYSRSVGAVLRNSIPFAIIYGLIIAALVGLYSKLPSSFLPTEDQGMLLGLVQLPPNASIDRTSKVMSQVSDYAMNQEKENIQSLFTVSGFSFTGVAQNAGMTFIRLKDWSLRHDAEDSAAAIAQRAASLNAISDLAYFAPIVPPAIMELGTGVGFDLQLQDVNNLGHDKLIEARNKILGAVAAPPYNQIVTAVRPNDLEDTPQYRINIDQAQAGAFGLSIADINATLAMIWGGSYINDFMDRGRVKKVYVQGDAYARMMPEDLNKWYARNDQGQMIPFASFATIEPTYGPAQLIRYNGIASSSINGQAAPGVSSGQAMETMEKIVAEVTPEFDLEWTALSLEEKDAGNQQLILMLIAILFIFLCLAALYESWSIPFAVLLVVPLGLLGSVILTLSRSHFDPNINNNIYFQVAILAVIGLSAKNAILIVEFAKSLQEQGKGLIEATVEAAKQRLRPIIMTSLAFGAGVLPLLFSSGAGSGSQNAVGYGVFGGVLSGTLLAIFFVPLFFIWVRLTSTWVGRKLKSNQNQEQKS